MDLRIIKIFCWFSILPIVFMSTAFASPQVKDYSALLSSSRCTVSKTASSQTASYTCKKDSPAKIRAHSSSQKNEITRSSRARESRERNSNVL